MKRKSVAACAVLVMVAAGICRAEEGAAMQPAGMKEYVFGEAKVLAGFKPTKAELVAGEPLTAEFMLENKGSAVVDLGMWGGNGMDRYSVTARDDAGKELVDVAPKWMGRNGMMQQKSLKAGEKFAATIDLAFFRKFEKPGVYQVECSFSLTDVRPGGGGGQGGVGGIVTSQFELMILERTPEHIAAAMDDMVRRAMAAKTEGLPAILNLLAQFGAEEAVTRLEGLAAGAPTPTRLAVFNALAGIPGDAALKMPLAGLAEADSAIQMGAAAALGASHKEAAVNALLAALPKQNGEVAAAILGALGNSKSERAIPVLRQMVEGSDVKLQMAAISGLAANGGPEAIELLKKTASKASIPVAYRAAHVMGNDMGMRLSAEWLQRFLLARHRGPEWYGSLSLMRGNTGENAIPSLLACVDFDVPWSSRNWWLLDDQGVKAIPGAPSFEYVYDPNRGPTPEEIEKNKATLAGLKPLARPLPLNLETEVKELPKVELLKTNPQIDFIPVLTGSEDGELILHCGFYDLHKQRNGESFRYQPDAAYAPLYEKCAQLRALLANETQQNVLNLTAEQKEAFHKLTAPTSEPHVTSETDGAGEFELFWDMREAPPGPVKDRARAELLNAFQKSVQDFHASVVAFVEASAKILDADQMGRLADAVAQTKK